MGDHFVTDFVDAATGVFPEDAFQHMLTRETRRAARYQDFFSLCLLKPDVDEGSRESEEDIEAAIGVANRIRSDIEQVTFRDRPDGRPYRLTLSIGEVSFPRHGHDRQTLLVMAAQCLGHAAEHGGNRVVYASDLEPRGGPAAAEGAGS